MKLSVIYFIGCLFGIFFQAYAQDDLLSQLEDTAKAQKDFTAYAFKSTRIINAHTLEVLGRRALDFRIAHRFGTFNSGANNLWGLDGPASIKLSLEYCLTGRWMIGIGRSNVNKMFDAYFKHRLLRQTTNNSMPVSVTLVATACAVTQKDPAAQSTGLDRYASFSNRMSYATQFIIGRKFSKKISLQVSPTYIHWNLVTLNNQQNDLFAITSGGRYKFSRSMAITFEHSYRFNNNSSDFTSNYNSLAFGWDIETGGHVFQMFIANSTAMNETQFIPYTNTSWKNGGIRLGFNVSRVFAL